MEQKEITVRPDDNVWKIVLALVCIGILAYGFFYSDNTTTNFGYLFGLNLPLALLVWAIFYAAVARKRGARVVGFSFVAIFISMIASDLIGVPQQKQEVKQALTGIQEHHSALIDSSTDSQGLPKRTDKHIDSTPKARGEFGEMERVVKEFMNQMALLRNDYLLELEAVGWNSLLDPQRIRDDKGFVESKVIIRRAKKIVAKYKEKTNVPLHNAREKIQSLNVSESLKRATISGLDRGMENPKIDEMWALEGEVVKEVENIINLLSAKKGSWVVEEGQILFYNDSDLNRFNSHIASIQSLANQQQQIQKQTAETANRNFNRLKETK